MFDYLAAVFWVSSFIWEMSCEIIPEMVNKF